MIRPILVATAIAGTLDILAAFFFAGQAGMAPASVRRFVASGPFGDAMLSGGTGAAVAGLLVHYAIMACMAAAFILTATRMPALVRLPIASGVAYGLLLWFVMYWIVRPLRWETLPHPTDPKAIAGQLFCHLLLVGIPIAIVAARCVRAGNHSPR